MAEDPEKTQQAAKPATVETPAERDFFFPKHGKTVYATSQEEAQTKLADLLKKDNKTV